LSLLVVLVLAAAVVAAVIVIRRARQVRHDRQPPPPRTDPFGTDAGRPDPRRLKIGDIVGFDGRDYVVRGTIRLDQSGFTWEEHLLDDTTGKTWLSVEDDEGLELCLWHRVTGSGHVPGSPSLTDEGVEYFLAERGEATFRSEGTTGTASSGHLEYIDYAAGDRRLSFERFGATTWEVSRGRVVGERELTIYPVTD
jgi:hypothetical protein